MSTLPESGSKPAPSWIDGLAAKREQTAYVCLGLGAFFFVTALFLGYRYKFETLPAPLWAGLVGLTFTVIGIWRLFTEASSLTDRDFTRLQILVLGGLIGFVTVLFLGFGLGWTWWETISGGWQKLAG